MNIAVDGRENWIPVGFSHYELKFPLTDVRIQYHFSDFQATLYSVETGKEIGSGDLGEGRRTFPGRQLTYTTLDLHFQYDARNVSDPTWLEQYNACSHIYPSTPRPTMSFIVQIKMKIRGIIGSKGLSTTLSGIACPIELPSTNA